MAKSALFRVGLAFQVALADVTGLRFAIVDGIDILDGANRATLFSVLDEALAKGWLEQVIVLATALSAAAASKVWPPGWGILWVDRIGDMSTISRIQPVSEVAA